MSRTIHGIAYNPLNDEILVPNPLAKAVLVFGGKDSGDIPPRRMIQGAKTQLVFPHSISFDAHNKEILVADPGGRKILVFPWNAYGDVAPLRVIEGPLTKLGWVTGAAVDPVRNLLVTSSVAYGGETGLFIFNRMDQGNVAPRAAIAGPKTGIQSYPWQVEVYQDKIFAAISNIFYYPPYDGDKLRAGVNTKAELETVWKTDVAGFIGVWNISDDGDVAPQAVIKGPQTGLIHPSCVALDIPHREIITTDGSQNGAFTFSVPELFR